MLSLFFILLYSSPMALFSRSGYFLIAIFVLSNLLLSIIPTKKFFLPSVSYTLFCFDVVLVSICIYLASGIDSDLYLVYFLTIFMATIMQDIKGGVIIAFIAALLYGSLVFKTPNPKLEFASQAFLIRIPFLFITALFSGFLAFQRRVHQENLERELRQSQQLAVIGEMLAGLAHEIKNPLHTITGFIQMIENKIEPENEKIRKYTAAAFREIKKLNKLVIDVLDLARQSEPKLELVQIKEILASALSILYDQLVKAGIKIKEIYEEVLPQVKVDPYQIRQVFINIIANAVHAMPTGGTIEITAKTEDDKISVAIADTGVGIPQKDLKKIFLPFFSTKKRGSGLGLDISKKIVEKHQGEIKVESYPKQGTKFTIKLPLRRENENNLSH